VVREYTKAVKQPDAPADVRHVWCSYSYSYSGDQADSPLAPIGVRIRLPEYEYEHQDRADDPPRSLLLYFTSSGKVPAYWAAPTPVTIRPMALQMVASSLL